MERKVVELEGPGRAPTTGTSQHGALFLGTRLLLKDPAGGGGGLIRGPGQPTHPPTHTRKIVLRQRKKFIKGAGNSIASGKAPGREC